MDIFEAIRLNLISEVQRHIESGTNLDAPDAQGLRPIAVALDAALLWHDAKILEMLELAGANLEPLAQAIAQEFQSMPAMLLHEHNSTAQAINDTITKLKSKLSQLTADEKVRLETFLRSAEAFSDTSQSLRDRLSPLREAVARSDEKVIEDAVSYLIEVAKFRAKAMWLRMESVVIDSQLV
jgi:hypothetical protein